MYEKILLFIIVLVISVAFLFSAISIPAIAGSENTSDTVDITVNISSTSQITLLPSALYWPSVGSGQEGGSKKITAKNIGSRDLVQLYAYVDTLTTEPSRPYGSGDPSKYSTGGILTIKNETNLTTPTFDNWSYFYLGRIEWNWTEDIPNHIWTNVTNPLAWGYFTNRTDDYVWVLGNDGTGNTSSCNGMNARFAIESESDLGTLATRIPGPAILPDGNDSNWAYFSMDITNSSLPLYKYCVAAYKDCNKIYIYKFDKRDIANLDFIKCVNSAYLYYGNVTGEGLLMPGDTTIFEVDPIVPYGTPAGNLTTSTLTVVATSST